MPLPKLGDLCPQILSMSCSSSGAVVDPALHIMSVGAVEILVWTTNGIDSYPKQCHHH